jgi:hypothetical protein
MPRFLSLSRVLLLGGALALAALAPLAAQDAPAAGASPFSAGLSASLSTESISGETYQAIGLLPDLGFGPFGVGLDLSFHFRFYETPGGTFGFYPRSQDWWDTSLSTAQNVDKYLSRIAYLRWGKKGDPLYVQAGLLPATTLGSGFIVGGYTNGALRPALKYTGLEVDASGDLVGFPYVGFESFTGNISAFDVVGARAYVKPFGLFLPDNGLLKSLQVGLTFATDTNAYAQDSSQPSRADAVIVTGVDALAPLVTSDVFSAIASLDLAAQGTHTGASLGVGGKAVGLLQWGLQARALGDNFLADYFDQGYEVNRVAKYAIYKGTVTVPGTIGWLATLGTSLAGDQVSFGATLSGPFTAQTSVYAQPQLQSYAKLKAGFLPVSLDAFYVKNGLDSFAKLVTAENALIGAKVGYQLGAVTLSIVYDLRYLTPAEQASHNGQQWVTTSRVETAVKMF